SRTDPFTKWCEVVAVSAAPHHVESNRAAPEREQTILDAPSVEHDNEDAERDEDGWKGEPREVCLSPVNVAGDNHQDEQGQHKACKTRVVADAENTTLGQRTQLGEHDGTLA